jgi:cytoskeletal protein RodZ
MIDDETSEASTIDCSPPTQIDVTLLDQPSPRLREILAAARDRRVWVVAVALALLLGINLLIFGRMSATETRDPIDIDRASASTAIPEASTRALSDAEPDSQASLETREAEARRALGLERPPVRGSWGHRSRLFSGEALRAEAAIDSEIAPNSPAVRPTGPSPSLAAEATSRKPAPSPAEATPSPRGAKAPSQPSESAGGHGWVIERK